MRARPDVPRGGQVRRGAAAAPPPRRGAGRRRRRPPGPRGLLPGAVRTPGTGAEGDDEHVAALGALDGEPLGAPARRRRAPRRQVGPGHRGVGRRRVEADERGAPSRPAGRAELVPAAPSSPRRESRGSVRRKPEAGHQVERDGARERRRLWRQPRWRGRGRSRLGHARQSTQRPTAGSPRLRLDLSSRVGGSAAPARSVGRARCGRRGGLPRVGGLVPM